MRILIKGYYGFGNLGDDVLLITAWRMIKNKYSHAEIFIYSNFNENLIGYSRKKNYNHYLFKLLGSQPNLVDWTYTGYFDLVIDGGGGVYFDFAKGAIWRKILNALINIFGVAYLKKFDDVIRTLVMRRKRISYKKRIAIGLGLGPYTPSSSLFYDHAAEIGSTNVFFVRDLQSLQLLDVIGYKGKKYRFTDLAFLNHFWMGNTKVIAKKNYSKKIGIVLMDWHDESHSRYNVFKEFADNLIKNSYQVTFFSFDENTDKVYKKEFDPMFNFVTWLPNEMEMSYVLEKLGNQDIVFSARAHGVILTSLLGVPAVCLGTSQKLVQVSNMFPRSAQLVSDTFSAEGLFNQLIKMEKNYSQLLDQLSHDVEDNKTVAINLLSDFHSYLDKYV